jgi:LPXTG-motif cell wall-anchored protein
MRMLIYGAPQIVERTNLGVLLGLLVGLAIVSLVWLVRRKRR